MSETLAAALAAYGIDLPDALERMDGNADLYKKLALKYLDNDNYASLVAAMEAKDYDEGYKAAHALKGVAGNLSFAKLFEAAGVMSGALYQGEYQAAEDVLPRLADAQAKVVEGLARWHNGDMG